MYWQLALHFITSCHAKTIRLNLPSAPEYHAEDKAKQVLVAWNPGDKNEFPGLMSEETRRTANLQLSSTGFCS